MNARRHVVVVGCALAACVVVATSVAWAKDFDRMQGNWKATYGEIKGKVGKGAALKGYKITVEGNIFTLHEPDRTESVHFEVDQSARPKHIDFWQTKAKKKG